MWIFRCLETPTHIYLFPDYKIHDVALEDDNIIQYCRFCQKEINVKRVRCQLCDTTVGHVSCVEKWLTTCHYCPVCNQDTFPVSPRKLF
jgi:hypothetical protein